MYTEWHRSHVTPEAAKMCISSGLYAILYKHVFNVSFNMLLQPLGLSKRKQTVHFKRTYQKGADVLQLL
jgi:hypothetical protein